MVYSTASSVPTKTSASIDFCKYQAAGNDFILIDGLEGKLDVPRLCDRHYGVGADGVILLENSSVADMKMRFFNPDGYEAGMCGNGLRCVVRHLGRACSVETKVGILQGKIVGANIAVTLPSEIIDEHLVFTGTRHYVAFVQDFYDFEKSAPILRHEHSANVNFAIVGPEVHIRTYEMGVEGETLACGTGAAAVATLLNKNTTIVHASGHKSFFSWDEENRLQMEGPAEFVFAGKIAVV